MNRLAGLPVVTAAELRSAEAAAVAGGTSTAALMATAGTGVAHWIARLASGAPALILCGPGNNGGDGYVAAARLREAGVRVSVAASSAPNTLEARAAAREWAGPIVALTEAEPAPVVVDALFGTGAIRALAGDTATALRRLMDHARLRIAVDLPSGLDPDGATARAGLGAVDLTLALGALKPAHVLQPGAALCGAVRCIPLGLSIATNVGVLSPQRLPTPGPESHKYSRGLVAVVGGAMPGAARLAAEAALRSGAGYALLLDDEDLGGPAALVTRSFDQGIDERRIGALLVGPGLGRDEQARSKLRRAVAADHPLVLDGDGLRLLNPGMIPPGAILTPHAGEFAALFGAGAGSKLDMTRAAAATSNAVVVHKGADTVIAAPDGRVAIAPSSTAWLSTAGTGDVLAGAIAAMRAAGLEPFAAACAGVWLHGQAAAMLGPAFIADDLVHALTQARAR